MGFKYMMTFLVCSIPSESKALLKARGSLNSIKLNRQSVNSFRTYMVSVQAAKLTTNSL